MARIAALWTINRMYQKVLKSVALAAVGFYLCERLQRQQNKDGKREYLGIDQGSTGIATKNGSVSERT